MSYGVRSSSDRNSLIRDCQIKSKPSFQTEMRTTANLLLNFYVRKIGKKQPPDKLLKFIGI